MTDPLEQQLEKWNKVFWIYLGAGGTLVLVALIDLPARLMSLRNNSSMVVDGWCGVCAILFIACLIPGALLLAAPRWREAQIAGRACTGFGFLGIAWLALLGFSLYVNALLPMAFHLLVFILGVILAFAYLFLKRRHRKEEIFP